MNVLPLHAERLRTCWAVHPVGALGTCGWIDGIPWTVIYAQARTEREALARAERAIRASGRHD